jgi:hypothetical protein
MIAGGVEETYYSMAPPSPSPRIFRYGMVLRIPYILRVRAPTILRLWAALYFKARGEPIE